MWRVVGLAGLLGAVGFAVIEGAGRALGVRTAMTPSLWLDGAAFALAGMGLAALYVQAWSRGGWARRVGAALAYVALFPFVTALLGGLAELTFLGGWGYGGFIREALLAGPINLLATFTLELGVVALPLGVVSVTLLLIAARSPRQTA